MTQDVFTSKAIYFYADRLRSKFSSGQGSICVTELQLELEAAGGWCHPACEELVHRRVGKAAVWPLHTWHVSVTHSSLLYRLALHFGLRR